MRALRVDEHGGPEAVRTVELPLPEPGPGQVRIRVSHVGLNHLDLWVRNGVEGHRFPLPLIPGADIVGIREDTGEAVALHPGVSCMSCARCLQGRHDLCPRFRIRGERIDGGCCEAIVVPTWQCLPLEGLAPEQAAALPLALLTAWHLLDRAGVGPSDRVLVQAGAGGVASLAIQLARRRGARVVATASTAEKRALCLTLGAEQAWDYDEARAGLKAWHREGVDVVVEHPGAATWPLSMRAVRWGGTVVTCGATSGHEVSLDLRAVFFKQLSILGSTMGSLGDLGAAWQVACSGGVEAVVHEVLPMTRIADAYALIEGRRVLGKVVLRQDLSA